VTDRILGYLAGRFTVSDENVASEAMTWILGQSAYARSAVITLVREAGATLPADLTFLGQVGDPDTGRPDIVARDANSRNRLLIEAKFAAALTENQPNGYLSQLPNNAEGVLLVVAPERRIPTLWVELVRAAFPSAAPPALSFQPSSELLSVWAPTGQLLALTSWRHLLDRIRANLDNHGEVPLARDLEQVKALTDRMDQRTYVPARPSDLDARTGQLINQLSRIIDGVHRKANAPQLYEKLGRASHGRIFYGWYLRGRISGKAAWVGFLPRAWAEFGMTPLWMRFKSSDAWSRQRLTESLSPLNDDGGPGVFEDGTDSFLIPLLIPVYAGEADVVSSVANQVSTVFGALDAHVEPGEPTVPEEPADEAALDETSPEPES
jgi:hypothetical protein